MSREPASARSVGILRVASAEARAMSEPCEDCADGIYPHYGAAPGVTCGFMRMVAAVQRGDVAHRYTAGFSNPAPREEWPPNFTEDSECPGMGVYECPRCMINTRQEPSR